MKRKSVFDSENADRLLVFKAKYDNIYFRACNWEAVYAAALCMLKVFNDAHYYDPRSAPKEPRQSRQYVDELPDNTMEKVIGIRNWEQYEIGVEQRKRDVAFKDYIDLVLKTQDGETAWDIIKQRGDLGYEYETFSVVNITPVECSDD